MAHESFSRTVLETAWQLAAGNNGEVTTEAIALQLGLKTRVEYKRMLNTLSDLHLAGRLQRFRQGVYGPVKAFKQPDKRQVMWQILRMRKRVTVEDMMVMAEVSKDYAREWLATLVKREVVRKQQQPGLPATWQLINDTVDMPVDDAKAAKLRELRQRKKREAINAIDQTIQSLQSASEALSKARDAITTMEEGE